MSVNDHRTEPTEDLFEVKGGANSNSATFIFGNEDHTLGNALRHVLMQRPETDFCGYSVPHPYEPKMNLRLQVYEDNPSGSSAIEVLKMGLQDLEGTANILDETFNAAVEAFKVANEGTTQR